MSIDLPEMLVIHLENAMKGKKNEIPELKQAAFMPNIQRYYAHQRLIGQQVTHLDYGFLAGEGRDSEGTKHTAGRDGQATVSREEEGDISTQRE